MTDTTDMLASRNARAKIAAQGHAALPAWVNPDALDVDWNDVEYRRDYGPHGVLLAEALARWAKAMMPVSEWPSGMDLEGPVYDKILSYLGFDDIEYVVSLIDEIHVMLEERDNDEAYQRWTNDPNRRSIWEVADPPGWIDMRNDPAEAIGYVTKFIEQAGGIVTWPEASAG